MAIRDEREIPVNIVVDNFKGGLVKLVDQTIAPAQSVVSAKNMMQVQDGRWATRWGTDYYGADLGGVIEGLGRFVNSDGVSHLVAVVNVSGAISIKRSTNDGQTWQTCTGAGTRTPGFQNYFVQANNYFYITNAKDGIIRYNGTTTLVGYSNLSAPTWAASNPITRGGGLAAGNYTNSYKVSAINEVGETIASASQAITTNIARDNWKNDPTAADTQFIDLSWNAVTGAERYNVYYSDQIGQEVFLKSVTSTTYHDNAKDATTRYIVAPTINTTIGPKLGPTELSGNRIWGTQDYDNPWRVWWSGTFPHMGAFNPYYDGGYVDLELGGAERPQTVIHYRDGKGGSFATILTADPEGSGSIWQVDLQVVTVGNYSYTQPVPTKVVGSVGTIAPLSVVKVKNDIMFFNRKGFFTLGSKAQMLNLLSSDEISANIRPDVRSFSGPGLPGIAGVYFDAKVFYSVPLNDTKNNAIYVNDTERRNWAGPWTFGVRQFLVYSDNAGSNRLLAIPTNGSRLIEISPDYPGDAGFAFETELITPLIPINGRDRTAFAKIDKAYIEVARPAGSIQFTLLGTDRKGKYSNSATLTLTGRLSGAGFGSQEFSDFVFSDTDIAPGITPDVIARRYIKVRKKLNAVQFKVTTNEIGASYTLLTLQAKGFLVDGRDPNIWKA